MADDIELHTRVVELVSRQLPGDCHAKRISIDQDLTELGLDSMSLINLLLSIEESFEIVIPAEMLTEQYWSDVGSIVAMLRTVLHQQTNPAA